MKTIKTILRIFIILLLLISCKNETDDTPEYEFKEYIGDVILTNYDEVQSFGVNNYTSITGSLTIELDTNTNNDLAPLSSLNTIGGDLKIYNCDDLPHINGLSNVNSVGGDLWIQSTNALSNLNGLSSITSVGGDLVIQFNVTLSNLDGLSSITSVGGDLGISNNAILSDLCGLTDLITNNGLIGTYYVGGNAFNPTQQDIIDGNCSQ